MPTRSPVSTANLFGHPIRPMPIPFPIAFFVSTFACDVAFWLTGNATWTAVSVWLLGAGIVMALLVAVAGLTDCSATDASVHSMMLGGTLAVT
jgi:uncharacterized membrane protein